MARALLITTAASLVSGAASGSQAQQAPPTSFTAPDGSRFVFVPDPAMPVVHWVVATPAEDPERFPGLALATMRASLGGTWATGSLDPQKERAALEAHDAAHRDWLAAPADVARVETLQRTQQAAAALCDPFSFRRVLAGIPVHRPEVEERQPFCLLSLTTVAEALPDVANILVERREDQALRELEKVFVETSCLRSLALNQDPNTAMRAEVLALAIPGHPYARLLDAPAIVAPSRAEAFATWHATQRPERTVHVLVGGFDPAVAATELGRIFATTALPPMTPRPAVVPRPITSLRRSVVTGTRTPTAAVAFVLPDGLDRTVLEAATRWLADGPDSAIGQELQRLGRSRAQVRGEAPWPPTTGGQGLLLLEVSDAPGSPQLGEQVLQACRKAAAAAPTAAALDRVRTAMVRRRTERGNQPRLLAADLAIDALQWPGPTPTTPDRVEAKAIQALLATVVKGQPVVVEGRP